MNSTFRGSSVAAEGEATHTGSAPVQQPSLFQALPVLPYGGQVPTANNTTSREAAVALTSKLGKWQRAVLIALYDCPGLSDEGLDRYLDCERTRTARPRRRELEVAGYIDDSGQRCVGVGGTNTICWVLSPTGETLARALKAEAAAPTATASIART